MMYFSPKLMYLSCMLISCPFVNIYFMGNNFGTGSTQQSPNRWLGLTIWLVSELQLNLRIFVLHLFQWLLYWCSHRIIPPKIPTITVILGNRDDDPTIKTCIYSYTFEARMSCTNECWMRRLECCSIVISRLILVYECWVAEHRLDILLVFFLYYFKDLLAIFLFVIILCPIRS